MEQNPYSRTELVDKREYQKVQMKPTNICFGTTLRCLISKAPCLSFLNFFPALLALFPPYSITKFSTLLVYYALIFLELPPYSITAFSTLLTYQAFFKKFHPTRLAHFQPYSLKYQAFFFNSTLLDQQIFQPTRLFGLTCSHFPSYSISKISTLLFYQALLFLIFHKPIFHLLVYQALLFYEICSKYPPYSFIRPYLFNRHL